MKTLLVFLLSISGLANAGDFYPYASIGVGYKFHEAQYQYSFIVGSREYGLILETGGNDSALFEAGIEYGRSISFGIKHDSQYSTGWPFNDKNEYHKTEVFIRYKLGGRP